MIDADPFSQFIVVPDDPPVLSPVDEDIYGLKDLTSLGLRSDLLIDQGNESGGLLLIPDSSHNAHQGADTLDVVALSSNAGGNAFFPISDLSPSCAYSFLPGLSPDSSPISVVSTPLPKTPAIESSFANVTNFTPVNPLWDISQIEEESCSILDFLDQSGNNLEDLTSQDVIPEDIACTPQIIPTLSLPCALIVPQGTPLSNTPILMVSPPPGASTLPGIETASFGRAHSSSLPPISHSLFEFSPLDHCQEALLLACPSSPSLSPLTTVSSLSQSPSTSPNPSPLINCSPLSPALSPVPLSSGDDKAEETQSVPPTPTQVTSIKLRTKRNADTLDEDGSPWRTFKHSKAKNIDEEEWSPETERVKRLKAVSSSQSTRQPGPNYPPDESSVTISQGSEGHSDTTYTTCQICGQGFTRASDYVRHIQNSASHPETRKMWPCPYCDSALGRKDALGRHIKTLHPGKPIIIPEGVPGNQLPEGQKVSSVQRSGQRKIPSRRQPVRKDTRRFR